MLQKIKCKIKKKLSFYLSYLIHNVKFKILALKIFIYENKHFIFEKIHKI